MASVGEGAARGLESGFRLAMAVHDQRRQGERQDAEEARRARMDSQAQEDRARALSRQGLADRMTVQGQREAEHAATGQGYQSTLDAGGVVPQAAQQAYEAAGQGLASGRRAIQGEMDPAFKAEQEAYSVEKVRKKSEASAAALMRGDIDTFGKDPDAFRQMVTATTGFAPADYKRGPQGEPSRVEQGGADLMQGMKSGDQARAINGANIVFAPELNKGIGEQGPRGTVVAKRIVNLVPHPGSSKEDMRVIPTIRVFVNSGKATSGDEVRTRAAAAKRAAADGVELPPGATGYYDAPLTERRSSDPDDPVKAVSVSQALEKVGKHLQFAELINSPQGAQLMEIDAQSQWDPERFKQELARRGIKATKPTVNSYTLKPGEVRIDEVRGKDGSVRVQRRTEGPPKLTEMQQVEAYAEEHGIPIAKARALFKPSKAANAAAGLSTGSGGGGGGDGGPGLSTSENRLRQRQIDAAKVRGGDLRGDKKTLLEEHKLALNEVKPDDMDGDKVRAEKAATRAKLNADYEAAKKALDGAIATHDRNQAKLERELEMGAADKPPPAAGKGKLTKDAAAAKFGF